MKWSDGEPFTSENFRWWYENVMLNTTLTPAVGTNWVTGPDRTPMTMTFPDDYTVVFSFAHPNPMFLDLVAPVDEDLFVPHHYLAQFHADMTDDRAALDAAMQKSGFESWDQYFVDRNSWFLNPDRPSVWAYLAKNALSEELFIMERNPYFWQVDPEGKQYPYIDT
jgi:peptide/nickel transport system substrate-binding protein